MRRRLDDHDDPRMMLGVHEERVKPREYSRRQQQCTVINPSVKIANNVVKVTAKFLGVLMTFGTVESGLEVIDDFQEESG